MKKLNFKHIAKELTISIIVMAILMNIFSYVRKPSLDSQHILPFVAASIDKNVLDSSTINKPTLLHFWATWCPTCKLESSNIERLSKHYNVITVAVKSGSDANIKAYMQNNGYSFKVINDKDGTLAQQYKISAYPTSFIYNSKQKLEYTEVGYTTTIGFFLRFLIIN